MALLVPSYANTPNLKLWSLTSKEHTLYRDIFLDIERDRERYMDKIMGYDLHIHTRAHIYIYIYTHIHTCLSTSCFRYLMKSSKIPAKLEGLYFETYNNDCNTLI